jgi:hypothetical protein
MGTGMERNTHGLPVSITSEAPPDLNDSLQAGPVMVFLEELRDVISPEGPHATVDNALDIISDHSALCMAQDQLTLMGKDKKINVLFHACIVSMVGMLNLFLDPKRTYTWRGASLVSSKVQGHGIAHTQHIRE